MLTVELVRSELVAVKHLRGRFVNLAPPGHLSWLGVLLIVVIIIVIIVVVAVVVVVVAWSYIGTRCRD